MMVLFSLHIFTDGAMYFFTVSNTSSKFGSGHEITVRNIQKGIIPSKPKVCICFFFLHIV